MNRKHLEKNFMTGCHKSPHSWSMDQGLIKVRDFTYPGKGLEQIGNLG